MKFDLVELNFDLNFSFLLLKSFWLLRLFELKLFDMLMVIVYLFNFKEFGVFIYFGNKLFVSIMWIVILRLKWIVIIYNNFVLIF